MAKTLWSGKNSEPNQLQRETLKKSLIQTLGCEAFIVNISFSILQMR